MDSLPIGDYALTTAATTWAPGRREFYCDDSRAPSGKSQALRGLATGVARWFGREPVLEFTDWAEFERRVGAEYAEATREHTVRSITASIDRARQVLGRPRRWSS
jgi:hypothetical protein